MSTPFTTVYDKFLSKVSDDETWMNLSVGEMQADWQKLLETAIYRFKYPKVSLEYSLVSSSLIDYEFPADLTYREVEVLSTLMVESWLERMIADIHHLKLSYKERGYEMPSQANHLDKLEKTLKNAKQNSLYAQDLYTRVNTDTFLPRFSDIGGEQP